MILQLKVAERKCRKFKSSLPPTAATATSQLKDDVEGLRYMLTEIKRSIDTAARNPNRYKLTNAEIQDRRAWLDSVTQRVDTLASHVWSLNSSSPANRSHREGDGFLETELGHQDQIMARQDQELDVLGEHVLRIGELGREMGQELEAQGQLLDEFGYEMQGTQTRLAAAQRKVQYVLDRAGTKGQLIIIAVLVVVLVVLMLMILS